MFYSQFSPKGKVLESPAQFHAQDGETKINSITSTYPVAVGKI